MGIKTVAVFSEPDREALHTQLADEAVCIGSAKVHDSYLNMNNIICAAVEKKVQAIHPGFGFLSENSTFAAMCEECNIKFIGPSAQVIDALGNKSNARDMMVKAGVPVIPGSDGVIEDTGKAHEVAKKLGYPVMVKASAGGGGKGIRIVRSEEELEEAFESARSETIKAFGDDKMYMEKLVEKARHVEVQVIHMAMLYILVKGTAHSRGRTRKCLKKPHALSCQKMCAERCVILRYWLQKQQDTRVQALLNSCMMKHHRNIILWK